MRAKLLGTGPLLACLLEVVFGVGWVSGQTPTVGTANAAASSDYSIVQRGPYSRVWQRVLLRTNAIGVVSTNLQGYTELATGICYPTNGQYTDSVEEVDSVPGGAQAVQGQYQVQWALNANTPGGAVTVTIPDAHQLTSTVVGLAWYDVATGSNAALATLKDCNGSVVAPNQVLYADAFSNLTADVWYTYKKDGLSQDISLRQSPPAPDTLGLNDDSSILQVYTEFFNAQQPAMTAVTNGNVVDDQLLDFGEMKMGIGQALFLNGQDAPASAGIVTKQWVQTNGRTFLIESIPYNSISNQLQQLPHASNLKPGRGSIRRLAFNDSNTSRQRAANKGRVPMKLAKVDIHRPRLVVDYDLLSSTTNLTLQGDTTYFVSGAVNITGTLTIEGGTVVKYTNNSSAQITASNILCSTSPYSPGVFTSMNDNSVGSEITGSTGTPTIATASYYINFHSVTTDSLVFRNLRFSYANYAIGGEIVSSGTTNSIEIWDCQFINCGNAFYCSKLLDPESDPAFYIYVYNVLFSQCNNAVNGGSNESGFLCVNAVNVTADQLEAFLPGSSTNVCYATNSLFTSVTNVSAITSVRDCFINASSNGVYQTVGAGGYYLAEGSTNRNAGTTNIDTNLLADLQTKTTYPPVEMVNQYITSDCTFSPQAQRDIDTPDLGYHYSPIDYAITVAISNATATILPGTVLAGCVDDGVWLYANAVLNCQGTATSPNYLIRYNAVQEQSNTNWEWTWQDFLATPGQTDSSSANFTFTQFAALASDGQIDGLGYSCPMGLQNCQFYNGTIAGGGPQFLVTNCLFRRVASRIVDESMPQAFFNNLFYVGSLKVNHGESLFTFRDNLFDQTVITNITSPINVCSNNAYVTTNFNVLLPENNDVILTSSPAYQVGPLGNYYYPDNLPLIYAGSRLASKAGLAFYTVMTNNTIDGTNMVSVGFHYLDVGVGADGLPDATNGISDAWQLQYLGQIGIDSNADFDNSGLSVGQDYEFNIDPDVVAFYISATNEYVKNGSVPMQMNVLAGVPFQMAWLVDDTNFADASWMPYNPSFNVSVGTNLGWHQIWVGLCGLSPTNHQTWAWYRVKLDTTPPLLIITNPPSTNVTQPMIEVQGYCPEPLASLAYDLSNAAGVFTNQPAFMLNQYYTTNTWEFTTNTFQAFDVPVTNGANVLTFHATDLAGNVSTTNFTYTLNYANATNPPVVQLFWPQKGAVIGGASFTWRGNVSEFISTLAVQAIDTNGDTNDITAIVERNGNFWVQIPLTVGTNWLTLTATDAASNAATTNILVVGGRMVLTVDAIGSPDQLWQPTISLTGTVSDTAASLSVNGVSAVNNGDGTWSAANVPVNGGGTAVFDLVSVDSGVTNAQESDVVKPPRLYLSTYNMNVSESSTSQGIIELFSPTNLTITNDSSYSFSQEASWSDGQGGTGELNFGSDGCLVTQTWPASYWPVLVDGSQDLSGTCNPALDNDAGDPYCRMEHCDLNTPTNSSYGPYWGYYENELGTFPSLYSGWSEQNYARQAQTTMLLNTGSQGVPGQQSIFQISASATDMLTGTAIPPEMISIGGLGNLDTNGNLWVVLPDNDEVDVTPRVGGDAYYVFTQPTFGQYILTHTTACTADENTNDSRTTIGIGETVDLAGMPGNTTWSVSGGGTLIAGSGGANQLTASMSPGSSVVTAEVAPGVTLTVTFSVLAPTGVAATLAENNGFGASGSNSIGAYSSFYMHILPLTVAFNQVTLQEVGGPYTIRWPNTNFVEIRYVGPATFPPPDCENYDQDAISDGPFSLSRLFNGTNYVSSFSFTYTWNEQYLNQDSNWVTFTTITTTTKFDSSFRCQETYQGVSGSWQGPWLESPL